jgi:hypothetical protein
MLTEIFAEKRNAVVKSQFITQPSEKETDKRPKYNMQLEAQSPDGTYALFVATQRTDFQPQVKAGDIVNVDFKIRGYNGLLYCDLLKHEIIKADKK